MLTHTATGTDGVHAVLNAWRLPAATASYTFRRTFRFTIRHRDVFTVRRTRIDADST